MEAHAASSSEFAPMSIDFEQSSVGSSLNDGAKVASLISVSGDAGSLPARAAVAKIRVAPKTKRRRI